MRAYPSIFISFILAVLIVSSVAAQEPTPTPKQHNGVGAPDPLSPRAAPNKIENVLSAGEIISGNLTQTGATTRLKLTNGFVTTGVYNEGLIPATGPGRRLMFYSRKAAFRAGAVGSKQWDDANVGEYSIAMGEGPIASGDSSLATGSLTVASGVSSTAMGRETTASGDFSVAFGADSLAGGRSAIAMGLGSKATGTVSTAIGYSSIASGDYSVAIGSSSSTNGQAGSLVYGDRSKGESLVTANTPNSWTIRASGGYRFFTNGDLTTGVSLSAGGGAWNNLSDRNAKDNITAVNPRDVLRRVLKLPISTWSYKGQSQFLHIGPMAQDFFATFKVGESDKTISTVDPGGVALAAIQGLNEKLEDRDKKIEELQITVAVLKKLACSEHPKAIFCRSMAK